MCVDLTLFPLDTIKTRLQSQQGFYKAGGFKGIYAGVPSAAVGSFPNGENSLWARDVCTEKFSFLFCCFVCLFYFSIQLNSMFYLEESILFFSWYQ